MSESDDSYDYDPMPQSPAPACSEGFTFDDKGFHVGGIARQASRSLARLKLSKFTKPWYTAQLMLYGVPFVKNAGAKDLLQTLDSARTTGKTKQPTNEVVQIEQRLTAAYAQNVAAHAKTVEAWRDRKFARLPDATCEMSFDKTRFFAKYFLDDNGQPAPSKTRDGVSLKDGGSFRGDTDLGQHVAAIPGLAYLATPELTVIFWEKDREKALDKAFDSISTAPWAQNSNLHQKDHNALASCEARHDVGRFLSKYFSDRSTTEAITLYMFRNMHDKRAELRAAAAEIPGLKVGELADVQDYLAVGWGDNIYTQLRHIEAEMARQKQEEEDEERRYDEEKAEEERKMRERKLAPHREYIQNCTRPAGALELAHLPGRYILEVTSKELHDDYGLHDHMFLSVCAPRSRHGCVAGFDIDMVDGTMLLALSEEDVHALAKEEMANASDDEDYDEDVSYGGLGKRPAPSQDGPQPTVRLKLDTEPRPGRAFFQWAGRERGEGEMQLDDDGRQAGFIDFDESGCTATGILKYPSMFGNDDAGIPFSIYKTSDTPGKDPEPWSQFTDRQYGYEASARWH